MCIFIHPHPFWFDTAQLQEELAVEESQSGVEEERDDGEEEAEASVVEEISEVQSTHRLRGRSETEPEPEAESEAAARPFTRSSRG